MARVIPEGWRELEATGAAQRELETLGTLARQLPATYTVYHGVHWTRVDQGHALIGEIDFAVVSPAGAVLLIEQKSGLLDETDRGLAKKYPTGPKNVPFQMARNAEAIRDRLRNACPGLTVYVDALLYCPDYLVRNPGTAGIDPARIVDAKRRDQLAAIIERIVPADDPPLAARERVHRFLADVLQLVPEIDALSGAVDVLYTRLSAGLAHWARRIDCDPFRLRVIGTAGSGKTQLAMAAFRESIDNGHRPLYVCYNRPLADHIGHIAPPGGEVLTYHQLAHRASIEHGESVDFRGPGAFARIEALLDRAAPGADQQFDELIIDEAQDFKVQWVHNLLRFLRPSGRAWLLEDPMQNLYGRAALDLPGWVTLRSATNYRSPRQVRELLNQFLPLEQPIDAGSPLEGPEVDIVTYADTAALLSETARAVTRAYAEGFKPPQIAIVTYRGREHSRLAPFDRLGPHALRAPTGEYDLLGNAVQGSGDILIDSVHRFKGRAAPCVIFTEVDFEHLDEQAIRRIFVGATRATLKLTVVIAEHSARELLKGQDT